MTVLETARGRADRSELIGRQWSEAVLRARCDGPRACGVGAARTCYLAGRVTGAERWAAWDEGRPFAYEGAGLPLVKRARNAWTVRPAGRRPTVPPDHAPAGRGPPASCSRT